MDVVDDLFGEMEMRSQMSAGSSGSSSRKRKAEEDPQLDEFFGDDDDDAYQAISPREASEADNPGALIRQQMQQQQQQASLAAANSRKRYHDAIARRIQIRHADSDADGGGSVAGGRDRGGHGGGGGAAAAGAPAGNNDNEPISGQWGFRSFNDDAFEFIPEENTDTPNFCYMCECSQDDHEMEKNAEYKAFLSFLYVNYPKMTRTSLAIQGQGIYNNMLRKYTKQKKSMRCITIIRHIEKHAPTALIQLEYNNRIVNDAILLITDKIKQVDESSGEERLHPGNLRHYLQLMSTQNELMAKLQKLRPDVKK